MRLRRGPVILAVSVLLLVCGLRLWNPDLLEQFECKTYDLRVRTAQSFPAPIATNLAFVAMDDSSIKQVRKGLLGQPYGLYWPRHIYGRLVEELSAEGARAVAFDVLFGELRPDHGEVVTTDGRLVESDDFFAVQMARASNVITAFTTEVTPPDLFTTNSIALGDISTDRDSDGVLRRIKAFSWKWHAAFKSAQHQWGVDLNRAQVLPGKVLLPSPDGTNYTVSLDHDGNFDLAVFVGNEIPEGFKRFDKPCTRVWDLGIVMAAQELHLDLDHAEVDLAGGRIVLRGPKGVQRVIPVDDRGFFYINWQLTATNPAVLTLPVAEILKRDLKRGEDPAAVPNDFRGRLVVIGSAAQGNDLSDHGATPLERDTLLVSKHWNVANSIITGQFVHRTSPGQDLALIALLGALTALATWKLRPVTASFGVAGILAGYVVIVILVFAGAHWWLPIIYPLAGAVLLQHTVLLVHRVVFEQREQRRVKSIFSKIVAPEVVNEVLGADVRALKGSRREMTVFFADIRGFTALADQAQEQVAEFVRHSDVDLLKAEEFFEESARELLETVNLYLAAVADVIKKHGGTLDKYIGDCVMAFWNAPLPNEKHALRCVQAAIDAQRAILVLNEIRQAQNPAREAENKIRVSAGLPPRPLHVSLQLGTGINTGVVTVGFMGSDQHIVNYTVFGREVNLASRLETHSGSGRIIISDTTYNHLLRASPELAAICKELFPVKPKGFLNPVRIYEVPWQTPGTDGTPT